MKLFYSIFVLFAFAFLISCTGETQFDMEAERSEVLKVLDNFVKAHEDRNLDLLLTCFSDRPDILILGTDEDELWVDKMSMAESQKRAYQTFNTVKLSVRDKILKMCKTGGQAWFYMKVNWYVESEGKQFSFDGIRTTGVLEKENNKWQIVQIHTSMPVKGQAVRY